MMDIIIWSVILIGGLLIGRHNKTTVVDDKRLLDKIKQLENDVAYYKKLTKTLVDENTELRKK